MTEFDIADALPPFVLYIFVAFLCPHGYHTLYCTVRNHTIGLCAVPNPFVVKPEPGWDSDCGGTRVDDDWLWRMYASVDGGINDFMVLEPL